MMEWDRIWRLILWQLAGNKDIIVCKPEKGGDVVISDSSKYSLKIEEILSDCTKFVQTKINTIFFRYQDNVSRFGDKPYNCSSIDDDGKNNIVNSGSTPEKNVWAAESL